MSSVLRATRLIDNCTPSISYDAQVQAASGAFDRQMFEIIDETGQVVMIPNIMGIEDSNLIDILAWQFHVDFYDSAKDLEFRKRLVQMSIVWHKTKGTPALVEEVINTYFPGGVATLYEWYEYKDPLPPNYPDPAWHDRYRFQIAIDEAVVSDAEKENQMVALIDRYKPVSRWLEAIVRPHVAQCDIGWAGMVLRFIYRESEAPNYP
jgi:phage tail P2-like protein